MKNLITILILAVIFASSSCKKKSYDADFEDALQYSIYSFIDENMDDYSSFQAILEKGGIYKTLSAYNPYGIGYTLFLPDNDAVDRFIEKSEIFDSLQDILDNEEYCKQFSRYHVLDMGIGADDFPFGAFPVTTLSEDFLTVSFKIETDTSFYMINNQAGVTVPDIKVSNGYIHLIDIALLPIASTSYEWIAMKPECSIFKEAVDRTGLKELIDFDSKKQKERQPVTLFLESDSIFNANGVMSFDDLSSLISPDDNDYTNIDNPLNNFIRYHILTRNLFLDDFEGHTTNYSTLSEIPLNINGKGLDIAINKGKEVLDTIINGSDTTIVDYITFLYDESNVLSKSGAIHFINYILTQQTPSKASVSFGFYEEPLLNEYRKKPGTYLIEDTAALNYINWKGTDLSFVNIGKDADDWIYDYLMLDGDFEITYELSKIVQGKYEVYISADSYSSKNAVIEVYIDGQKIGGLIDLSEGGSASSPFQGIKLGMINFNRYMSHKVTISTLIPGRLLWNNIQFVPAN